MITVIATTPIVSVVIMKTVYSGSTETSLNVYQTTWKRSPEYSSFRAGLPFKDSLLQR
jgi:hypothetical protein